MPNDSTMIQFNELCLFLLRVDLTDADDDEDDKCSLTVALMQTKRRKLKAEEGKPMLTIGFSIYKVL